MVDEECVRMGRMLVALAAHGEVSLRSSYTYKYVKYEPMDRAGFELVGMGGTFEEAVIDLMIRMAQEVGSRPPSPASKPKTPVSLPIKPVAEAPVPAPKGPSCPKCECVDIDRSSAPVLQCMDCGRIFTEDT